MKNANLAKLNIPDDVRVWKHVSTGFVVDNANESNADGNKPPWGKLVLTIASTFNTANINKALHKGFNKWFLCIRKRR
jgi:hypothetical protein